MKKVVVTELSCKRCGHSWIVRKPKAPKVCPKCKRFDWNSKEPTGARKLIEVTV